MLNKPLDVKIIYPNNLGSADLKIIIKASNGKDYAVKDLKDGNGFVPLTEIFCYELAKELDLATPNYRIIKMPSGELAFGSEWEGGVIESNKMNLTNILMGKVLVQDFNSFISKLYGLDIFINNEDRHFGNYIFRNSFNNGIIPMAFDFSRALYTINNENPFNNSCLTNPNCNTFACNQILIKFNRFEPDICRDILDKICNINISTIEKILDNIPNEWFNDSIRDNLISWWKNDMINRIKFLKGKV